MKTQSKLCTSWLALVKLEREFHSRRIGAIADKVRGDVTDVRREQLVIDLANAVRKATNDEYLRELVARVDFSYLYALPRREYEAAVGDILKEVASWCEQADIRFSMSELSFLIHSRAMVENSVACA